MTLNRNINVDLNQQGKTLVFRKRVHSLAQILKWYGANNTLYQNGKQANTSPDYE